MAIFSTTTGWTKPRVNKEARNAHLMPELSERVHRIITGARSEQAVANRVLQNYVELWQKLHNGRPCTCTFEKAKEEFLAEEKSELGIRLEDFLFTDSLGLTTNKEFCPLCFSTGIVGGYKQSGVDTIILDASLEPEYRGVYLTKEKPWWFQAGAEKGYISWEVTIPTYFNSILDTVIRWNNHKPSSWRLLINGEEFSHSVLNSLAGQTVTITMEMSNYAEDNESEIGLISIWLRFEVTHALVPVELPNLIKNWSTAFMIDSEVTNSISINFDDTQGKPTPNDIFVMPEGYCWRIISVQDHSTLPIQTEYNCEARLVRSFENYYLIPSRYMQLRYPMKEYTFLD